MREVAGSSAQRWVLPVLGELPDDLACTWQERTAYLRVSKTIGNLAKAWSLPTGAACSTASGTLPAAGSIVSPRESIADTLNDMAGSP